METLWMSSILVASSMAPSYLSYYVLLLFCLCIFVVFFGSTAIFAGSTICYDYEYVKSSGQRRQPTNDHYKIKTSRKGTLRLGVTVEGEYSSSTQNQATAGAVSPSVSGTGSVASNCSDNIATRPGPSSPLATHVSSSEDLPNAIDSSNNKTRKEKKRKRERAVARIMIHFVNMIRLGLTRGEAIRERNALLRTFHTTGRPDDHCKLDENHVDDEDNGDNDDDDGSDPSCSTTSSNPPPLPQRRRNKNGRLKTLGTEIMEAYDRAREKRFCWEATKAGQERKRGRGMLSSKALLSAAEKKQSSGKTARRWQALEDYSKRHGIAPPLPEYLRNLSKFRKGVAESIEAFEEMQKKRSKSSRSLMR